MKKFYLGCSITMLMLSCTAENSDFNENEAVNGISALAKTVHNPLPENAGNPYDITGRLYFDIRNAYSGNSSNSTLEQIALSVDAIAFENADFMMLRGSVASNVNIELINEVIYNPKGTLEEIIAASSLSILAQASLTQFIDTVEAIENEEYDDIYSYIISYETVILSSNFSEEDSRVLLSTSSIARYELYRKKRPRDRDWETSVGNIVAAAGGALDTSALAIKTSVVTDIGIVNQVIE